VSICSQATSQDGFLSMLRIFPLSHLAKC